MLLFRWGSDHLDNFPRQASSFQIQQPIDWKALSRQNQRNHVSLNSHQSKVYFTHFSFPDGTIKCIFEDGEEESIFPDGTIQKIEKSGIKAIEFANGQKDILYPDGIRVREFPDGKVRKTFPDGHTEVF